MSSEYAQTREFRGASFRMADLGGARFRDCDLSGVRIASSFVDDLQITGFDGKAGRVVVDDVDVSGYVQAELDRRYPERLQVRSATISDDYRATWARLAGLWEETVARARRLPEDARRERVDGEWSFVETLCHLVFAIDTWAGRMTLEGPFSPLGLTPTDMSDAEATGLGIDVAATPSFDEAVAEYETHARRVSGLVRAVTDDELAEVRTGVLTPAWGEESYPVAECLRVILHEHCEHRRFAVRDLTTLEGGRA